MTDQEILDNAPEGEDSDVVDITGAYFDEHCNHLNSEGFWSELHITPESPRSIADIKRIVELEKERNSLLRLISYVKSIVFSKVKCSYVSFKRPLEELLKDQGNG